MRWRNKLHTVLCSKSNRSDSFFFVIQLILTLNMFLQTTTQPTSWGGTVGENHWSNTWKESIVVAVDEEGLSGTVMAERVRCNRSWVHALVRRMHETCVVRRKSEKDWQRVRTEVRNAHVHGIVKEIQWEHRSGVPARGGAVGRRRVNFVVVL
jgi:hypothetical protein